MLTETRTVEFLDNCIKMQSVCSAIQLPELIKSFDPKFNQQEDVSQVKPKKPLKMKLRDAHEVLEIARLKVLISEMKEKAVRLEGQLLVAARQHGRSNTQGNQGVQKPKEAEHADTEDPQSVKIISRNLLEKQAAELDKSITKFHSQMESLRCNIDEMALQLPEVPGLQKELASSKEHIRRLQVEIKDDAGITKSQLLLLKQQFGELEKVQLVTEHKELEFCKASQLLSMLEAEVEELRKGNKELLHHKQELSEKLVKAVKTAATITPVTEDDVLTSQAEVSRLRATHAELQKKVESLQMSRFNEVEELVYLRWVNACLRHDLDTYKASHRTFEDYLEKNKDNAPLPQGKDDRCGFASRTNSGRSCATYSEVREYLASEIDDEGSTLSCESSTMSSPQVFSNGHANRSRFSPLGQASSPLSNTHNQADVSITRTSPQMPHHDIAKVKSAPLFEAQQLSPSSSCISQSPEAQIPRRCSMGNIIMTRDSPKLAENQLRLSVNGRSRRSGMIIDRPVSNLFPNFEASSNPMQSSPQKQDPRQFMRSSSALSSGSSISASYRSMHAVTSRRHSAPSGAELPQRKELTYMKAHSFGSNLHTSERVVAAFQALSTSLHKNTHRTFKDLLRQNSPEDRTEDMVDDQATGHPASENAHMDSNDDCMSGEIWKSQSGSTQSDFFCDLARAIQATHYTSIEKVAAIVNWFDRQGDVEKQAFFHFPECPKDKIVAMRRAVYEYEELLALECDLKSYNDDFKSPIDLDLKGMKNLLEKVEHHIEGFKQARELAMIQFTELELPTYWMLDSEMIAKVKQASLQLAQKYIKRFLNALQDPQTAAGLQDEMLLQSATFLLRIHNFAGGFDEQTAYAFRMLQSQADIHNKFSNGQDE